MDSKKASKFLLEFKNIWADAGSSISKLYAGTDAATTGMTKTGSHGLKHKIDCALVGAFRYYNGRFSDPFK